MAFVKRSMMVTGEELGKGKIRPNRHGQSIEQTIKSARDRISRGQSLHEMENIPVVFSSFRLCSALRYSTKTDASLYSCPEKDSPTCSAFPVSRFDEDGPPYFWRTGFAGLP